VLSLAGEIISCTVKRFGRSLMLFDTGLNWGAEAGMPGSPILAVDGSAIGVVCLGSNISEHGIGPNPCLVHHLPGWFLINAD
jgi:hypothetical protein